MKVVLISKTVGTSEIFEDSKVPKVSGVKICLLTCLDSRTSGGGEGGSGKG